MKGFIIAQKLDVESWGNLGSTSGSTESERYLVRLARRTFLSLWSYPNVYTDEGRRVKGDGKELCDLLVVFGNDLLLFSDKHCEFIPHKDINVAWNRWYKRAIEKSARQLAGADAWLNRFPGRVFLDRSCEAPLPIKLPDGQDRRVHLIAVTRGSSERAKEYWGGGSSGSLMLDTRLVLSDHRNSPFRVGWVLPNRRFIHVFDETTLDIVLGQLDTVSDFVAYLTHKHERLTKPGPHFLIPGEEELVALYLRSFDPVQNRHFLPEVPKDTFVVMREGDWEVLLASKSYRARRKENAISYLWDELIEFQNRHIISGTATALVGDTSIATYERVMRSMAEEDRLTRRTLGASVARARSVNKKGKRFSRTILCGPRGRRAYVIMSLPRPSACSYEEYQEIRRGELLLCSYACKRRFVHACEVIGIAFEPCDADSFSVDFFLITFGEGPLDEGFAEEIQQKLSDNEMWKSEQIEYKVVRNVPFPVKLSMPKRISRRLWGMLRKAFGVQQ